MRNTISEFDRDGPHFPALDFHRQKSLKPCRCHLITVCGWTMANAERQSDHSRESKTQKIRSRGRSLGRFTDCL